MKLWNSDIKNQIVGNIYLAIGSGILLMFFPKGLDVFLRSLDISPDFWLQPVAKFVSAYWLHMTLGLSILMNAGFVISQIRRYLAKRPIHWLANAMTGPDAKRVRGVLAWFVFRGRLSIVLDYGETDFFRLELWHKLQKAGVIFRDGRTIMQCDIHVDDECYQAVKMHLSAMDPKERDDLKRAVTNKRIDEVVVAMNG